MNTSTGGRGATNQKQKQRETRSFEQERFPTPFKRRTYPDAADTALSSRGLSEGSWLSWTGPRAPAELATKPKNKVMSLFPTGDLPYLSGFPLPCTRAPPRSKEPPPHLSRGAPSSHTG